MSVYDAVRRSGEINGAFDALVKRCARVVVRVHSFPPLGGHQVWDDEAVDDLVQGFYAARPIGERVATMLAKAHDEASFVKILETALRRHIQSELRATPQGSIARTLKDIISRESDLELRGEHVHLATWPSDIPASVYGEESLLNAAHHVSITRPRWHPESSHRAPLADRASLVAVSRAVLEKAGGAVPFPSLLDVIIARCGAADQLSIQPVHNLPTGEPAVDDDAYASTRAAEIWHSLDHHERRSVGLLNEGVREAARHLNLGKTRASEVLKGARAALREHLLDEDDPAGVVRALRRLAAADSEGGFGVSK